MAEDTTNKEQLQETKKQTVETQEQTGVLQKIVQKLTISNKNEETQNKIEKQKFADMLKQRARDARAALVSAPGKALKGAGDFIKSGAENTFKSLGSIFKTILGPAGIFGIMLVFLKALQNPKFREVISNLIGFVKGVFTNTFDFLGDAFNSIVDLVSGVTDNLKLIFGGDSTFKERTDGLVGVFKNLGEFIFNIGNSLITNVLEMFGVNFAPYDSAGAWLLGKFNEMWTGVKNFFVGAKDFVVDGYNSFKDWIVDKVSSGWMNIKNWFSGTKDFVVGKFTDFSSFVGDKFSNSIGFAKDLFSFSKEDMNARGITSKMIDIVGVSANASINFAKDLFGFGNPDEPFKLSEFLIGDEGVLTRLGRGIVGIGKKIYDPETGQIFGTDIPEIPSISDMFEGVKNLAKRIYDPESGAIFGFVPGDVFKKFKLPNIGDMFMQMVAKILPDPDSFIGKGLYALPGMDDLRAAAEGAVERNKTATPDQGYVEETPQSEFVDMAQFGDIKSDKQIAMDEQSAKIEALDGYRRQIQEKKFRSMFQMTYDDYKKMMLEEAAKNKEQDNVITPINDNYYQKNTAMLQASWAEEAKALMNSTTALQSENQQLKNNQVKAAPVTVVQGGNNTNVSNRSSSFSIQKNTSAPDTTASYLLYNRPQPEF